MAPPNPGVPGGTTTLLFGPQARSFQADTFHHLKSLVLNEAANRWVLDVLAELPSLFKTFSIQFPKLQAIPGTQLLQDLSEWFSTAKAQPASFQLPNILLSPLVVLTQLTQYSQYLALANSAPGHERNSYASQNQNTESVGFCIGMLSALAVSSAGDQAQFQRYGAVAVRLAVLIGAVVDAQDALGENGESKSFATSWNSGEKRMEMTRILQQISGAYVSVCYDENRATVTTSASTASLLRQQLRAAGVTATEVGIHGRFHCECYRDDIEPLISICDTIPELQFPHASELVLPTRSNSGGDFITQGKLHHIALRSILVEQSLWYQTFGAVHSSRLINREALLVSFGLERCVPPLLIRGLGTQLVHMANLEEAKSRLSVAPLKLGTSLMDSKNPQTSVATLAPQPQIQQEDLSTGLFMLIGYQGSKQRSARFRINTTTKKYEEILAGHVLAQTAPVCPASLGVDMAIKALFSLRPDFTASNLQPQIHRVSNQAPICVDSSRAVWLDLEAVDNNSHTWDWKFSSTKDSATTLHMSGTIVLCSVDDPHAEADFAKYARIVEHRRCLNVLNNPDADDVIQGRNIYKTLAEIVDYGEMYRGLQKVVGKGKESAGRVVKQDTGETWPHTYLSECFSQVGSIWVNCMTDRPPTNVFIVNGFEQWIRSPGSGNQNTRPSVWDVFACHYRESDEAYVTDMFIFDSTSGALMEVIIGINYASVSKLSMSSILSGLDAGSVQLKTPAATPCAPTKKSSPLVAAAAVSPSSNKSSELAEIPKPTREKTKASELSTIGLVKAVLADISSLEPADMMPDTQLTDLGFDAVMGLELARELEGRLECSLPAKQLMKATTLRTLVQCVQSFVGPTEDDAAAESDEDETSAGSPSGDSLSDSQTSVSSMAKMDVAEYLAEFLNIEEGDVTADAPLRDLGVGSSVSTELRCDIENKFETHALDDVVIEELTVKELDLKINGESEDPSMATSATRPETFEKDGLPTNAIGPAIDTYLGGLPANRNLNVSASAALQAFRETNMLTDQFIADCGCADYLAVVNPKQIQLCVALTVEAFEQLGCPLRTAKAGQKLERIAYRPQHGRLAEYLYNMLEKEARLFDVKGDEITRTAISPPAKSSEEILQHLTHSFPNHGYASKLTYFVGTQLADVLAGKVDGSKLIFGSEEGRKLFSGLCEDSPLNTLAYKQMEDFIKRLVSKLHMDEGPLKILEMGAGTGGTTKHLVPLLANLNIRVEYTFTDPSISSVAAARTNFEAYPFVKFRTHDIEKSPASDLLGTQHIIVASNAAHSAHNLTESIRNIHKALRPDGFLLLPEMTESLHWIDMTFGCLESWWLFDDGRRHPVLNESSWECELQSAGYEHVEWTDGNCPENSIQRIIIAMASGPKYERLPISIKPVANQVTDTVARQTVVDEYIHKSTHGFTAPVRSSKATPAPNSSDQCVLVTGATGSLGSHLIAHFAELPNVKTVVCLNRHVIGSEPGPRQRQSIESRGIHLDSHAHSKLKVFETDTAKPMLGLPRGKYEELQNTVTHVLHNAWPMSGTRPVKGFGLQFQVMRNLIDLVRSISCRRDDGSKVSFQFISSIATVGHYPIWSGNVNVPEERMTIDSVLSNGYGDAKFVCERMLDETLHKYPDQFRVMAVRLGQVAGSKTSGYWNPAEHLSFLIKSSQTLRALPDFDGLLSWTPVNDVAATLGDLLLADNTPHPIYHIDNPVRQPWRDMISALADALDIPRDNVIPFNEWVKRVRNFPGSVERDNPAAKLIGFLDADFTRMACGGLLLDTSNSREHSETLTNVGPVSEDTARGYVQAWKKMGFLYE